MTAAGIGLGALFALLAIGVPLGFAMALVGFVGFGLLVSFEGASYSVGQIVFDNVMNYGLLSAATPFVAGEPVTGGSACWMISPPQMGLKQLTLCESQ